MNRVDFEYFSFTEGEPPNWTCPTCHRGRLQLTQDSLVKTEDRFTREAWKNDEFDQRDESFHFTARFQCDLKTCREVVHMVGQAGWDVVGVEHDGDGGSWPDYDVVYQPHFVTPPLELFPIPKNTPNSVTTALKAGFKLAFADPNSAANQLRTTVECLLDELKVPKKARFKHRNSSMSCAVCGKATPVAKPPTTRGKFTDISLHQRIEKLPEKYRSLREDLLAVKWLGNAGSHSAGISREHMLTGYEIMERCLARLYDPHHKDLDQKIKSINRKKGKMETKRHRLRGRKS
jgi:hypothetical protein